MFNAIIHKIFFIKFIFLLTFYNSAHAFETNNSHLAQKFFNKECNIHASEMFDFFKSSRDHRYWFPNNKIVKCNKEINLPIEWVKNITPINKYAIVKLDDARVRGYPFVSTWAGHQVGNFSKGVIIYIDSLIYNSLEKAPEWYRSWYSFKVNNEIFYIWKDSVDLINQKNVEQVEISYFLKNYSQKLFNKSLSNTQIVEICNLYNEERRDMKIIENVDGFSLNSFANINSFCKTNKIKSATPLEASFNYIRSLDLSKIPFSLLSSNNFSILNSIPEVNNNHDCYINLNNEEDQWMDFLDIKKRCNIEKFIEYNGVNYIEHKEFTYEISNLEPINSLEGDWIKIIDYFYGDQNNDNYLDLIITLTRDGSYSAPSQTSTIIITSFEEGEFQNVIP
jgi:hypothetical protein